jgi:hypothetical protein
MRQIPVPVIPAEGDAQWRSEQQAEHGFSGVCPALFFCCFVFQNYFATFAEIFLILFIKKTKKS